MMFRSIIFLLLTLWTFVNASISSQRNIILIITDDQDIELGSMEQMPKTSKLMKEKGVYFESGFVTTPICCPSRSSILSGLYVHNHNVQTNNGNCTGAEWRKVHEPRGLAVQLRKEGYRTAYLGKYLNEYDGSYIPAGWDYWLGLVKNSKFYNYTVNWNGNKKRFGSDYDKDYFTDVVTNQTLNFLSSHSVNNPWQPFFTVVSYPAPHGPEDPAPQHADMFMDLLSHRTDSWNYAPNPDKQWILQRTGKMEPVHVAFTDILHRRRIQTLQSVDEGVHRIFSLLRDHNQLSNTYVLYTSDHGYHLGQFGLIKGKNMPYEFDIRVPFFFRGPGVPKNITLREPVSNIDIVPTFLDIAGSPLPKRLDGRSLLDLLRIKKDGRRSRYMSPWRDTLLIERGKMPKLKKIRDRFLNQKAIFSKEARLNVECSREELQKDCEPGQMWRCFRALDGRWRMYKCRENRRKCNCEESQREKRSPEAEDDNDILLDEDLVDEFLSEVYQMNMRRSDDWYQGEMGPERHGSRVKRGCACRSNSTHPIKSSFSDRLMASYDYSPRLKRKNSTMNPLRAACSVPQMNCFSHTADHWRTPPKWPDEYGNFCFCQNSNNNTYWCLRTVNETQNSLYCEFVTNFVSYYDLNQDPYQLTNTIYSLELGVLEELSERLRLFRTCKGEMCEKIGRPDWKELLKKNEELDPF